MFRFLFAAMLFSYVAAAQPSVLANHEDRFKADLLVVVAHPDDETILGAYLARAIFDEHKRVAVVFGTRGNSGGDQVGPQQANALAAIREIEARRALAFFGVMNVWFLDAPDTPGQDVLRSLETWDHGRSLGRLVRYVRLTRPEVIVTWWPDYSAGENHGDHQASGVLATEAFDMAGDPVVFPEQVTPARWPQNINNLTEGLQPWQAKKIYYASDASHLDFLKGQGPEYSSTEISPSKHVAYEVLAAEEASYHLTQSDSGYAAAVALQKGDVSSTYLHQPVQLVFGKSYVGGGGTADVFAGVTPGRIPFHSVAFQSEAAATTPSFSLGGPWHFYHEFWRAHGLEHLKGLLSPEVAAGESTTVVIPLLIDNPTTRRVDGKITVTVPEGWRVEVNPGSFHVAPGETVPLNVSCIAPARQNSQWQDITVTAGALGTEKVRVQVVQYSLPQ